MTDLFEKSIQILELPKVLERLAGQAVTQEGKERCLALRPMTDPDDVQRALDETSAAVDMSALRGSPSFSGVKPVAASLQRAHMGGALNTRELLDIAAVLRAARSAREYGEGDERKKTCIDHLFRSLTANRFLEDKITGSIVGEDEIADAASPELASIRRHIRATASKVRDILNKLLSSNQAKYLQEAIITQRNDRFVVPVKSEHKNDVPGLVHDVSSSGATFFIEPMGVVKANNELKELQAREEKEIERILAELSAECAQFKDDITQDYDLLILLDVIFARAKLAYRMRACAPRIVERGLYLRKARHPLLDPKTAVPIDIELGDSFDTLVITGPNTGGKTVTLKTLGLLTLMTQCGLHIPAADRSAVSVYERVLADIGDEQSIEQSLSTFSAHMTNIVKILNQADSHSLCLFDELCAGTDPTEGAALAISILSFLHNMKCRTMATTHYSELKVFALSTPGVENACCEFNVETLRPTYKLLIGIPGKSNAFAISKQLGLPDYIIDDAKTHLESNDEAFEDLLANLEQSRVTIEKEREEIASYKEEISRLKKNIEQKEERLDERKEKLLKNANEEAQRILREAKETADQTIRNINKLAASSGVGKELEAERTKLREKLDKVDKSLSLKNNKGPKKTISPKKLKIGDGVKVLTMNLKGTVSTLPNAKGDLYVQMGILRSLVNIKDLELLDEASVSGPGLDPAALKRNNTGSGKIKMAKSFSVSPEVNLIGMTTDEAMPVLDKYLDDAYLAHLPQVRVVHGRGTGALRAAVHKHLKKLKYVKEFRLGEFGEGDTGVTIVTFK